MDRNPHVAIIIPTYNRGHMLEACVASAAGQTYPRTTVYVCDDGSTDGTGRVLAELTARYSNVCSLTNRHRKGPQGPRMTALDEGSEPWMAFLDSDNSYHPTAIERCVGVVQEKPDVDVVFFGQNRIRAGWLEDERLPWMHGPKIPKLRGHILRELLAMEVTVDMNNGLLRREKLEEAGGLDDTINAYEDWELHIRMGVAGAVYESIEEPLMDYLVHGDQLTSDAYKFGVALGRILRRHRRLMIREAGAESWRDAVYRMWGHAKNAGGMKGARLAAEAVTLSPGFLPQAVWRYAHKLRAGEDAVAVASSS